MMSFIGNKKDVAQFAADLVTRFESDSLSIMIITRGSSEDCSVTTAIDTQLEDTVKTKAQKYFLQPINT